MNRKTYYLIADIIQKNRTWIKVIGTEKLVEMRILQDGMLKPLLFKAITLKSYREHYCFKRSCTWNINEYDLNMGLLALCKKDPSASERIKHDALTLRDVEYIIEKASFGIIKLELDDAKMLVICMSVSWVVLEWYLSHDFIVGNKSLSSCKSAYYVLYKCCFLLFSQVTYQYKIY